MRILRFIVAMIKFIAYGNIVDAEELKRRRNTCKDCVFKIKRKCDLCGCYIKYKTRLSTESCPEKKW
jgi:hypothetical protein